MPRPLFRRHPAAAVNRAGSPAYTPHTQKIRACASASGRSKARPDGPRLLRPAADGGALRKLRRNGPISGKAHERGPHRIAAAVRGLILRITLLNYAQRNFAHNSCYTHNRPRRVAAAAGQGLRAAAVKQRSGPQRSGPQQRHVAAAARAGLVAVVGGISGPQQRHVAAAARAGAKQGGPPSRAPAPAHPAQRRRGLGRVGLRRRAPTSRRFPARAIKSA